MHKEKLYIRQTTLPEIGRSGQEKLLGSSVVVVGCGGLGSAAAVYLAASGVGHVHLIDYDKIDASNLHRQVFYRVKEVGKSKSGTLAGYIREMSPFAKVSYSETALTKQNIGEALDGYSVILDCTDSLATKYLLNDYCVLNDKVLVYGSLYKHDGYVGIFNVKTEQGRSSHLRDAFPEIPKNQVPNCAEVGTLNPIVGIIGIMQANEVIKLVTGTGELLTDKILIYNSMQNSQYAMRFHPGFPWSKVKSHFEEHDYFDARCHIQDSSLLISAQTLKMKLGRENLALVSVVENTSHPLPFRVDLKMPLSKFDPEELKQLADKEIVFVCQRGIKSYTATKKMIEAYPEVKAFSLIDGTDYFDDGESQ